MLSLLTTDSWQQPHGLVGSGEHVDGFKQWPLSHWRSAFAVLYLSCAL